MSLQAGIRQTAAFVALQEFVQIHTYRNYPSLLLTITINCNFLLLEIISIVVSIRVDKIYDRKVVWDRGFIDKDSEPYQTLAYEANRAVSRTDYSRSTVENEINVQGNSFKNFPDRVRHVDDTIFG